MTQPVDSVPAPTRWRRRLGCLLGGPLLLLIGLILVGVIYQAVGAAADQRRFPPPGELIAVAKHRLHLYCTGTARAEAPTVILETMSGGMSPYWAWVQPLIAEQTRVCSYDRAGRAWSEPTTQPLSLAQTAADLHSLLQAGSVPGPYLLVGHSLGGVYARQFVADHPDEVVGLLLLDASHPEQLARFPELQAELDQFTALARWFPPLARLGLFRFYFATGGELDFPDLPELHHAQTSAFWSDPTFLQSQQAENLAAPAIYQAALHLGDLGDLPLFVLSAGSNQPAWWAELQAELPGLSTNSRHVTIPEATHGSLVFHPEHAQQTASAILELLNAVVQGTPLAR